MIDRALELLKKYYGYSEFRQGQSKIIDEILKGKDTVAIMPTGGGKSICYQIPALLLEGVTIVISPLISLMKDQVDSIRELGVEAVYINSTQNLEEVKGIISKIQAGKVKLVYIAPERLDSPMFLSLMSNVKISQVAVDEAHCVSQWGHDFRTSYRQIPDFINSLPERPVVTAFTATATEEVRVDIVKLLRLIEPKVFVQGFDRENLQINILKGVNKKEYILDYIKSNRDQSGIIYTATRKEADSLCEYFKDKGFSVAQYHAGLSDKERNDNQEAFVYDKVQTIIATNAFGMGIDKPNIRYVLHYNMPKTIENYYQEIGRAGRDGLPSVCTLLFSPGDIQTQKYLIDIGISNPQRKQNEYKKLQDMTDLMHSKGCLKEYILNYFGESSAGECNKCSNCLSEGELTDKTVDAQKVLSCIYRMKRSYGINILVDVLKGSSNKKIKELRMQEISTYGIMKEYTRDGLKDFVNALISHSYIEVVEGDYPVLTLNDISNRILRGEEKVIFKEFKKVKQTTQDDSLFERLRELRKTLASKEGVPPYVVFGDNTLKEMSTLYPVTISQLLSINGVGEIKAGKYGEAFITLIGDYTKEFTIETDQDKEIDIPKESKAVKEKSFMITVNMLKREANLKLVAQQRELALTTIFSHITEYLREGNSLDFNIDYTELFNDEVEKLVLDAISDTGYQKLKPIKEKLPHYISYDSIKAVILKNYSYAG